MNIPMSEKEKMLSMLTEICNQIEELESVLEASFTDCRLQLKSKEQEKIKETIQRLSEVEEKSKLENSLSSEEILDSNIGTVPQSFKLELGF
ncbi:hypothetical protein [Neobacillus cucumis]|uniref:hypothetical protein n=1 Tax=Neobacillus cucumis TaxID=1740721 RepID=UPI001966C491|nr:hypothetical protein [Neobacillus cucumis]MBM7654882.1 hypothetical protein [Neobacillus cucumis]